MTNTYFITGNGTEIGKTFVSTTLLLKLNDLGYSTIGMKPLASDAQNTKDGLRNNDALTLQQSASITLPYEKINPFVFEPPITPHLAAEKIGIKLSSTDLINHCKKTVEESNAEYAIIEGIAGWQVPLNEEETLADFAAALNVPVIFVAGIYLGCLNHSILTWQSMVSYNVPVAGWVANCIDPNMLEVDKNIATLKHWIKAPFLGKVPYLPDHNPHKSISYVNLPTITENICIA